jgi:hypothetical protein
MDLRRQAELAEERGPRSLEREADTARGTAPRRASGQRGQARVCARWGVFDGAMKLVESFDYNQRPQAEQLVAELNAVRKNGTTYFLQIVKEAMPVSGAADLD